MREQRTGSRRHDGGIDDHHGHPERVQLREQRLLLECRQRASRRPRNEVVNRLLERLDPTFDLAEPFQRIREAIGEARKMGVSVR